MRSILGLMRVELRGASMLAGVLTALMCAALFFVRVVYEAGPETLLVERGSSLWLLATVISIPVAAELFGGGRSLLRDSMLSSCPLGSGARLAARVGALASIAALSFGALFLMDRALDQIVGMAVAAKAPQGNEGLLPAAFALALVAAAAVGSAFMSVIAAALMGYVFLGASGAAVFALEGGTTPDWILYGFHMARHPACLIATTVALGWTIAPRGLRRREGWRGASVRTGVLLLSASMGAAVAAGAGSLQIRFSEVAPFNRPGSRVGFCMPSPDGRSVAINVYGAASEGVVDAWIVDVATGQPRLAIPRERLCQELTLKGPDTYAFGWLNGGHDLAVGNETPVYQNGSAELLVDVDQGTARPFGPGEPRPDLNPRAAMYRGPNRDTLLETTGANRLYAMGPKRVLALWWDDGIVKVLHVDGRTLKVLRDPGNF